MEDAGIVCRCNNTQTTQLPLAGNAIKLGQYNVEREGHVLTIPLYMGFLIRDRLKDVTIPDVNLIV